MKATRTTIYQGNGLEQLWNRFDLLRAVQRELGWGAAGEVLRAAFQNQSVLGRNRLSYSNENEHDNPNMYMAIPVKWILAAIGFPVLVAVHGPFRPEKLWIDEKGQ